MDLLRGLLDLPQRHPVAFPHYDADLGVTWSDEVTLDGDHANSAPKRGGLLALIHGGSGVSNTVLHVEACSDLRARISELVASRCASLPAVGWLMEGGRLWFRYAVLDDPEVREVAHLQAMRRREDAERHARLGI
jgi:hypothetical protein